MAAYFDAAIASALKKAGKDENFRLKAEQRAIIGAVDILLFQTFWLSSPELFSQRKGEELWGREWYYTSWYKRPQQTIVQNVKQRILCFTSQ